MIIGPIVSFFKLKHRIIHIGKITIQVDTVKVSSSGNYIPITILKHK